MDAQVTLKIVQVGHPVLRAPARALAAEEVAAPALAELIELMRVTMRDAPGVGLAAPQVGLPIRLAIIEDAAERLAALPEAELRAKERSPVPFHVLINPVLEVEDPTPIEFFEGCLSVAGLTALVPRARGVKVEALDHRGEPVTIHARGWYARILQHEIDHLDGTLCVDRMHPRSLSTSENLARYWRSSSVEEIRHRLGLP